MLFILNMFWSLLTRVVIVFVAVCLGLKPCMALACGVGCLSLVDIECGLKLKNLLGRVVE